MKKHSKEENQQWDYLYQYVKKEILQYDEKQAIQPKSCLRLRGLRKGKFMDNNAISDKADYGFDIVLFTFKANKQKILNSIANKSFADEMHKVNYICAIVQNNINEVYQRMVSAKKTQKKTQDVDIQNLYNDGIGYKPIPKKANRQLQGLW